MKTETAAKIRDAAAGALIILLTVLVVAGGADSVLSPRTAEPAVGEPGYRCDYPPVPADAQQSMAPDGRPWRAASEHLILPLIVKTDNTGKRMPIDTKARRDTRVENVIRPDNGSLRTSTAQVGSRLGRQFTLVGAKPSGTG